MRSEALIDPDTGNYKSYGNLIVIKSTVEGVEIYTYYAHLSERLLSVGDAVQSGELVGKSGKTGNATGPHLHLEMRGSNNKYDNQINPEQYLIK